jgi:hypothetical protein
MDRRVASTAAAKRVVTARWRQLPCPLGKPKQCAGTGRFGS